MAIAKKLIVFWIYTILLLALLATGFVAQVEYQSALNALVRTLENNVARSTALPYAFYQLNTTTLERSMDALHESSAVTAAHAYSSSADIIATRQYPGEIIAPTPEFSAMRSGTGDAESTLVEVTGDTQSSGEGLWSALFSSDPIVHLTVPVLSPVNPLIPNLKPDDFLQANSAPSTNSSLMVIGYVHFAINRSVILDSVSATVSWVFIAAFLALLLCAGLFYLMVAPSLIALRQLEQHASRILSGRQEANKPLSENSEFTDIAKVLNSVAEGAQEQTRDLGLQHKLLLLKADESASQLNQRDEELVKASQEISEARAKLHQIANYDHLTALPNRQLFSEQLNMLVRMSARDARPLAILFLNLNNFHRINESLGRSAGDSLLKEVAQKLVGTIRSSDTLAHYVDAKPELNISRLGGDEFALVLSHLENIDHAGLVAQRITATLLEPVTISGHELVISTSIGIAASPRNGTDVEDLLRCASTAMYQAKRKRVGFLFYSDDMEVAGEDDLRMETELRKAIDRNELSLHYQPQVDTSNGSIICAEAFMRWEHPEYGYVSPARFIRLAEKMGLLWELGDWVLVEACRQIKAFRDEGIDLPRIAINIAPQQFRPAFVERVREVLTTAGLPASTLELGLAEAILMDNDSGVSRFLEDLKDIGVYLSLENFGTSHAPLNYLSRHPLDELKIDRSFIVNCDTDKNSASLVKAIIAMASSLNLHTVAEGVETEGEYRFLAKNGVGIMRGYLFSKPVPANELQKLLLVPWHYMSQIQRMALIEGLSSTHDAD